MSGVGAPRPPPPLSFLSRESSEELIPTKKNHTTHPAKKNKLKPGFPVARFRHFCGYLAKELLFFFKPILLKVTKMLGSPRILMLSDFAALLQTLETPFS